MYGKSTRPSTCWGSPAPGWPLRVTALAAAHVLDPSTSATDFSSRSIARSQQADALTAPSNPCREASSSSGRWSGAVTRRGFVQALESRRDGTVWARPCPSGRAGELRAPDAAIVKRTSETEKGPAAAPARNDTAHRRHEQLKPEVLIRPGSAQGTGRRRNRPASSQSSAPRPRHGLQGWLSTLCSGAR